jgi:hypothetical protein
MTLVHAVRLVEALHCWQPELPALMEPSGKKVPPMPHPAAQLPPSHTWPAGQELGWASRLASTV